MRIIFMGTPDFAVPTLKSLHESDHDIVGVVTQPDRPKGRGRQVRASAVKQFSMEAGLTLFQPDKADHNHFIDDIRRLRSDLIVVAAFGQILKRELLDIPKLFCMNLHASLLPKYRGAAPINWAILNGETQTGLTTMKMDEGLDTGNMLLKKIIPIEENDTSQTLHDKLSLAGGPLVLETIDSLEKGTLSLTSQEDAQSTYAPKLKKEMGLIDWNRDAKTIQNLIRGLIPWPGAYTFLNGQRIGITQSETGSGECGELPGTVIRISDHGLEIGTQKDRIIVTEIKPEGKRTMPVKVYLQGHLVHEGDRFDPWTIQKTSL